MAMAQTTNCPTMLPARLKRVRDSAMRLLGGRGSWRRTGYAGGPSEPGSLGAHGIIAMPVGIENASLVFFFWAPKCPFFGMAELGAWPEAIINSIMCWRITLLVTVPKEQMKIS